MNDLLSIDKFNRDARVEEGNRFLIGNGHLGYRGVLEEENKGQMKGFNIVGVYDRYKDKWRESLNLPDPLFFQTYFEGKEEDVNSSDPLEHSLSLSLKEAILTRHSEFKDYSIHSERFLSKAKSNLLCSRIEIKAKTKGNFRFVFGLDTDIYSINGEHFQEKQINREGTSITFTGKTNEGKTIIENAHYVSSIPLQKSENGLFEVTAHLNEGELFVLSVFAFVYEGQDEVQEEEKKSFEERKKEHVKIFSALYKNAKVFIEGDEKAQVEMDYTIYSLLILGDEERARSIPARGVSGQTYKGAIFWDSEIFLLPFFALNEPQVARRLIEYRIKTLDGAKSKAKEFGYEGAFYAWESQDSGLEACSKYNVTDYKTGKPIRTYFNEKQIHISADIPYAIENYIKITGDESILEEGAIDVLTACSDFFLSYAKKGNDEKLHLLDVIGPDEYHERVNDNAFTNYMAFHAVSYTLSILKKKAIFPQKQLAYQDFLAKMYLPQPNQNGVIEQFDWYFEKEDCSLETVRSRLKSPKQYWGGKDGPASGTQIIKQADVVALLVLLSEEFPLSVKKANYDYYFPRTEHGSSLSSSMYSLLATEIGEEEYAYKMFRKSASIDLYGPQKLFAGGIYIGGTHPASAGGAYMSIVYGFSGLKITKDGFTLSSALPEEIEALHYQLDIKGKRYEISVNHEKATAKEVQR